MAEHVHGQQNLSDADDYGIYDTGCCYRRTGSLIENLVKALTEKEKTGRSSICQTAAE